MRRREKAFTLIELMVAVTLGVAVIAAAYSALWSSIDGSRRLDRYVEESTTLANLSDTMKHQFANAFYNPASDLAPVFTVTPSDQTAASAQAGQAPADSISFSYAWQSTLAETDPQYPYYTVTYFIADATTDSPGGLSRRIGPLWPRDVADEPKDELIAPEVRGLGIQCFDGTSWTNQWDVTASGLPRAVRLDLYVDGDRFGKDPWRIDAAASSTSTFETCHVLAWMSGLGGSAASQTAPAAPAGGGSNAPAG